LGSEVFAQPGLERIIEVEAFFRHEEHDRTSIAFTVLQNIKHSWFFCDKRFVITIPKNDTSIDNVEN
jgi:hypothetical protein